MWHFRATLFDGPADASSLLLPSTTSENFKGSSVWSGGIHLSLSLFHIPASVLTAATPYHGHGSSYVASGSGMPQVDLESLVCGATGAGAGDRKVSCETAIPGGSGDASPRRVPPPPPDPDFPPESITIRIGDGDGDAAFSDLNPIYERDDSTKGSTNPKFGGASSNPLPLKARSNSARIAGGAPAAAATTFFGLPVKIRPAFTRRQPSQGRILPDKRSGGTGTGEEPRSPKVSCIGKVLSDRERYGRRRQRTWWRGVAAVFRCGGGGCGYRGVGGAGKKMALEEDGYDGEEEEEPSVAAMRKFKSGRRVDTWAQEALAAVAASGETTAAEEEKKRETEHWVRLPVS